MNNQVWYQIVFQKGIQVGTLFVAGSFVDGVALRALGLEDLLTGFGIAGGTFVEGRH